MATPWDHVIDALDYDTCWQLVDHAHFGRLVVDVDSRQVHVPVLYRTEEHRIVFGLDPRSSIAHNLVGAPLCLEVNRFEERGVGRWTVMVSGTAEEATAAEVEPLVALEPPDCRWLHLRVAAIAGHREG